MTSLTRTVLVSTSNCSPRPDDCGSSLSCRVNSLTNAVFHILTYSLHIFTVPYLVRHFANSEVDTELKNNLGLKQIIMWILCLCDDNGQNNDDCWQWEHCQETFSQKNSLKIRGFGFSQYWCWGFRPAGMLQCVAGLLVSEVSEKLIAFIFKKERVVDSWRWRTYVLSKWRISITRLLIVTKKIWISRLLCSYNMT